MNLSKFVTENLFTAANDLFVTWKRPFAPFKIYARKAASTLSIWSLAGLLT